MENHLIIIINSVEFVSSLLMLEVRFSILKFIKLIEVNEKCFG